MNDKVLTMDGLIRISLMGGQARAFLADTTRLCERARGIHSLSRTATAALGRLLTGTAMLGWMLKSPTDSVTVSIKGGGPLGQMLAVGKSDSTVKGYVGHPDTELPMKNGKLDVGGAVGSGGDLTVIKDLGMREPYVGRVRLQSGEIAEDLAMYFTQSEQTPSLVSLGVLTGEHVVAAGGLIVQPMPGCGEAALQSLELSAPMFSNISGVLAEFGLEGAMAQLLAHLEPEIMDRTIPKYVCDCNRDRMERALISLGEAELRDMMEDRDGATLTCHFCNRSHTFSPQQLMEILAQASAKT